MKNAVAGHGGWTMLVCTVVVLIPGCYGCYNPGLRRDLLERAAHDFQCPQAQLGVPREVTRRRGLVTTYGIEGCGHRATYVLDVESANWVLNSHERPGDSAAGTAPAASPAAASSRTAEVTRVEHQGAAALQVRIQIHALELRLVGMPTANPSEALLGLIIPLTAATYEGCQLAVTVNGERLEMPPTTYTRESAGQLLEARVPLTTIERIGLGESVEGRACTARFEFSPHTQGAVRSFLAEFRAEVARHPPPPPPAEPAAP
jgi:hypothetical protein